MSPQTVRQLRRWAVLPAVLCVVYVVLELVPWPYGNTQLHTVMEVVATVIALIVGIVALVRFYARRNNMILFLGAGFLGTALLDGYHAVVTSTFFRTLFPSPPESLIPWSWNASRTFLAILLLLSWFVSRNGRKEDTEIRDVVVYIGVGLLTLFSFCVFAFVPLGPAYFPDFIFGRPEEFVAASFFFVPLVGYLLKQRPEDSLEYWIVNSLIVGFLCQTLFMARSYALFDGMFDMAHLLKIVSYCMVLTGLLAEMFATWRREHQSLTDALKAEQYLLNALVANIPDAVFFKDRDGRFLRVNQAMASDAGYSHPDDLVGKTDADIWERDLLPELAEDERRILETGEPLINKEEQPIIADGPPRWVLVTKMPLRNEADEIVGTFGVARDITQQKEMQLQLESARDAAESASRAKSAFLANMSHEIRTPMNAVMGLTELVLQSRLDDIQRDYLGTVMDSAESLLSVINDILDFSKIEAGMLQFEDVDFLLPDIVGDTVRAQALRAERKDLELACFVDPQIPNALLGDPSRLRQVLTNLISNAIKFTATGEVIVRIEQVSNENGHLSLRFSVRDTGIGIQPDQLESIFEPFEQADMSATREFGGTGLGLAICQRLVSLMGGQIEVDSEPGRGSTFHFTVEFQVSDKATRPAPVPAAIKDLRVLIVDDNATNRTILEQVLLAKEMAPVTAPSALDGFSLLQDALRAGQPFRLLVSDVHMPHIDGFGLAEMIRADASLSDLDIIQLTSTGKHGDQQRCQELRIAAQLTKPVKQSELYNVVIRTLGIDQPDQDGWLGLQEPPAGELPPLRILLVEDSLANQKVALAVLAGSGHTTVVANHGKEALSILESQQFDVILMDVQMPVMDGLETTSAIRAGEDGVLDDHQPIVAMTAHAMSGDRQKCLDAGMDEYVSKPVRRETLFKAIATAVGIDFEEASMSGVRTAATTEKLVNWNAPLGQLRGDHAVLKDITQSYIDETCLNLSQLPDAITAGNAPESRRLAHSVKGAMRFFRAEIAQQCGLELEELCGTGDLTRAPELFERLKSEVERVLPVLQRFVDTGEM